MDFIIASNKIFLSIREDNHCTYTLLKSTQWLKISKYKCSLQLIWHYCFIGISLNCPFSNKFCFFQGQPNTESFKLLASISLINCNPIIRDYKGLFFLLHYHRTAVKVQNPQNRMYPVLMTNTGLHPSGLSKTLQTGALHDKTQTVVPLKYLLILLPSSNQMPPSCRLFTFKSIWLFAWAVLRLCMSRNAVQIHVTRTPGRDWEKSCCFCFTRALWALACTYTKRLFYFLLKKYFIDLFIMPSFYLGWTETPCLDSLLYRNPEQEGNSVSLC